MTGFGPVTGGGCGPETAGVQGARPNGVPDMRHFTAANQPVRPVAVGLIRAALVAQSDGDSSALAVLIRRRLTGYSKRDRLRVETALTMTAALLASMLPPDERETLLTLAEADTGALTAALVPAALSDATAAAQRQESP